MVHFFRRKRTRQRRRAPLAEALVAAEEESLVLKDRTANGAAELVAPKGRLVGADGVAEEIVRVELVVAQVL